MDDSYALFIDGVQLSADQLPNYDIWWLADTVSLPNDTSVIAVKKMNTVSTGFYRPISMYIPHAIPDIIVLSDF